MTGQKREFPGYVLDTAFVSSLKEPVYFDIDCEDLDKLIKRLEIISHTVKTHMLSTGCKEIFVAGLARVPVLVAIGSMFRSANSTVKLIDHNHLSKSWYLLDKPPIGIKLEKDENTNNIQTNSDGSIAVSISFTTKIPDEDIPENLRNSVVHYHLNIGHKVNAFENQGEIAQCVSEIVNDINVLSKKANQIHVFLAAQSSVVIEMGARYQEGLHSDWVIYNYDASARKYSWGIRISKEDFYLVQPE